MASLHPTGSLMKPNKTAKGIEMLPNIIVTASAIPTR